MTPKARYNFMIDEEQRDGLRAIKERVGVSESEQIRRAIDDWLEKNGVRVKRTDGARKRAARS